MRFKELNENLGRIGNMDSLSVVFRAVVGGRLAECSPTGLDGFSDLDGLMHGSDEDLTETYLLDSIIVATAYKGEALDLVTNEANEVAKILKGCTLGSMISLEQQRDNIYGALGIDGYSTPEDEEVLDSYTEKYVDSEDTNKEEETSKGKSRSESDESLLRFYASHCNGIIDELLKRYTGLFASGYEVTKPTGVLSERGILKLSGSELKIEEQSVATTQMYAMFKGYLGLQEVEVRSVTKIAESIYAGYMSGASTNLYFPNKLLEFAFGRRAPRGDNQNSTNTYEKHDSAASWKGYCADELRKSVRNLVEGSLLFFLKNNVESGGDAKSVSVIESVGSFLSYLQKCMSMCLLMVEYKVVAGNPSVFKLRLCDPDNVLGTVDYTPEIIRRAFINGTGAVPYSYEPRFEPESFVKEYAHEFNHNISQAMPLFAYKAFDALQRQGVEPTWKNMILGKFSDGSVLKNGTHGVSMSDRLTHQLDAGSRAGKGVMTLNLLASAIYSRKNIFYLDRKPDMASMLKAISPEMFAVNGAAWGTDDNYGVFQNQDSYINVANIPRDLIELLGCGTSWLDLGDLFYMRALKLIMGIIMARGDGKLHDPMFGGDNGILLVVDEFKNFQENYAQIIDKMVNRLPGDKSMFEMKKAKLETLKEASGKNAEKMATYNAALSAFNESYNGPNFYALSYLNHMIADLEFLSSKRDAGFDPLENSLSDIFVIGQHIEHGALPYSTYKDAMLSGRYKQDGRYGLPRDQKEKLDIIHESFGFSLVSFKTCDAFFGRNHDDGRDIYLAQKNPESKAYGRLDDKAGNFAYMKSFTEDKRRRIVANRGRDNLDFAAECIYFKPFLVLNDDSDRFTSQMFKRCEGDEGVPWVTREEIISENPDDNDPTRLNRAVGFEQYILRMGISDYKEVLRKGVDIANYVVANCLGYTGDGASGLPLWMQFITDLRPEWMFTVKDVVDGARGNRPVLLDITKNPVIAEYYRFDPTLGKSGNFGGEFTGMNDFFFDDGDTSEDFSDEEQQRIAEDIRVADAMGDNDILEGDGEFDLFDDMYENIKEGHVEETGFGSEGERYSSDPDTQRIMQLLDELARLGVNIQVGTEGEEWQPIDYETGQVIQGGFEKAEPTEFGEDMGSIDYNGDIESYEDMMYIVTNDIIKKFGGLDRIHSLKVIGGSIVINGYYYRCKIQDMYAKNIPYDVRREINSGSISKLFNYNLIFRMNHIRDLEFDSTSFVYDYVSSAMGFGSSISVDKFFNSLSTLQVLRIGKNKFTRADYMEKIQGDDLFYKPRVAERYANAIEQGLGCASKSSWDWTKRTWGDKKQKLWVRIAKGTVGTAGTVTSWAGSKVVGAGKKVPGAVGKFARGVKDLFNS